MKTTSQISPMLAVSDADGAIDFYVKAFGAVELWSVGDREHKVAGLEIAGARFFLATESPEYGTRAPDRVNHTTVRIELFVDEPERVQRQAVEAGAVENDPVEEHHYPTSGRQPLGRMLQGRVTDPFGHIWLIGRILDA